MRSSEPLVESGRAHEMLKIVSDVGLVVNHAHAIYENANAFWSYKPSEFSLWVRKLENVSRTE